MSMAWLRAAALGTAFLIGAPGFFVAQDMGGEDEKPAENEDKAEDADVAKSAADVKTLWSKHVKAIGRPQTEEKINEFFGKMFKIAADYVTSYPDATDHADVYKVFGSRGAYGKNNDDYLRLCEAYLKSHPDEAKDSDWNKYYLGGALSSESRKEKATKAVKELEKQGEKDANTALFAAEIKLIDAGIRNDDKARNAVVDSLKANKDLGGSEDADVYRKVMRMVFANSPAEIKEGEMFPDWGSVMKAKDIDGKEITLADYKGKVVLIDFWAVWCGPCIREMPNVVKAYSNYNAKGFEVIGISLDRADGEERLRETIKGEGSVGTRTGVMPWRQIYDGGHWNTGLSTRYGVRSIPFTVLIDADGKVAATNLRGEALEKKLGELLGDAKVDPDKSN